MLNTQFIKKSVYKFANVWNSRLVFDIGVLDSTLYEKKVL